MIPVVRYVFFFLKITIEIDLSCTWQNLRPIPCRSIKLSSHSLESTLLSQFIVSAVSVVKWWTSGFIYVQLCMAAKTQLYCYKTLTNTQRKRPSDGGFYYVVIKGSIRFADSFVILKFLVNMRWIVFFETSILSNSSCTFNLQSSNTVWSTVLTSLGMVTSFRRPLREVRL